MTPGVHLSHNGFLKAYLSRNNFVETRQKEGWHLGPEAHEPESCFYNRMHWYPPATLALGDLKKGNHQYEVSLGCPVRTNLKEWKGKEKGKNSVSILAWIFRL